MKEEKNIEINMDKLNERQKKDLELYGNDPYLVKKILNNEIIDAEDLFGCRDPNSNLMGY